jgi:hypothetical protein
MAACLCNVKNKNVCCVTCADQRPGRGGCYPCNCWRNTEPCLQTDQTRAQKLEALR